MRPLIQLWLFLWVTYVVIGSAVSLLGFRHLDLSFVSLATALLTPLIQAIVVLALAAVMGSNTVQAATEPRRPQLSAPAITILVTSIVLLQTVWLTAPTSFGPVIERLVLTWILAVQLILVAGLVVFLGRRDQVGLGIWTTFLVALPVTVAALDLAGASLQTVATALHLPPLLRMVIPVIVGVLLLSGLWRANGSLRPRPIAGKLADGALGSAGAGCLITLLINHGGAQLGPFWQRLAGTAFLLCTALFVAALLQARGEATVEVPPRGRWIWWTSPATRLGLLLVLLASYLLGSWILHSTLGMTAPLTGEWITRAATIPAAQAAVAILFVRPPRH